MNKPIVLVSRDANLNDYITPECRKKLAEFADPIFADDLTAETLENPGDLFHDVRAVLLQNGLPNALPQGIIKFLPKLELVVLAHASFPGDGIWAEAMATGKQCIEGSDAINRAVAEWTIGCAILGQRRMIAAGESLKYRGLWQNDWRSANLLYGSTVGIIGLGQIGGMVARYLNVLGCKVIAYDKYVAPERAQALNVELKSLTEVLSGSDIISLHAKVTEETAQMLGHREFHRLKPGALLINSARSALYDEAALANVIKAGRIYACLDVFDQEPLPSDHLFRKLDNVYISSHIAGTNLQMYNLAGYQSVETLRQYFVEGELHDSRNRF